MDREHLPSLNLAVAGALARAGWPPENIARDLHLPLAFTVLLHQHAIDDEEPAPGSDARHLGAVCEKLASVSDRRDLRAHPRRRLANPLLAFISVIVALCSVSAYFRPTVNPSLGVTLLIVATACLLMTIRQARHLDAARRDRRPRRTRWTGHRATQQRP